MTTAETANRLAGLCRQRLSAQAADELYARSIVSVEAFDFQGQGREMRGKDAVRAKVAAWFQDNDVHSATAARPYVSPERFAVVFGFDWTRRATGERLHMTETAVYTVENGKIVREEFLYGPIG